MDVKLNISKNIRERKCQMNWICNGRLTCKMKSDLVRRSDESDMRQNQELLDG